MTYLNEVEVESALAGLASLYPSLCSIIPLPHSTAEGRHCSALRMGLYPGLQPAVLIAGAAHANEWGGAEICVYFAADLLQAFSANTGVTYGGMSFSAADVQLMLTMLNIIVFPLVNPDGRSFSMAGNPMWRKNRQVFMNGTGVDLNRNHNFLWDADLRAAPYPFESATNYKGPFPESEPETKNLGWLLNFGVRWFVDIHSNPDGNSILWGWSDDQPQSTDPSMNFQNPVWNKKRGYMEDAYREYLPLLDWTVENQMGMEMATAIAAVRGTNYFLGDGTSFYDAGISGSATDHAYSGHKTDPSKSKVLSFGIEFSPTIPFWPEMGKVVEDVDAGLFAFCRYSASRLQILPPFLSTIARYFTEISHVVRILGQVPAGGSGGTVRPGHVPTPFPPIPPYWDILTPMTVGILEELAASQFGTERLRHLENIRVQLKSALG